MLDRHRRLSEARLYLVCDERGEALLDDVLAAGVDIVQLRMKAAGDDAVAQVAERMLRTCHRHGALFIVNDRPQVAAAVGADGVHVGQDDAPVAAARAAVSDRALVGLSTHSPAQIDAARGVDYIGVGPVNATPTKPGRPAVGLELVRYAAAHSGVPFFAIGGIAPDNVGEVAAAGAQRVAVVRAIVEASDPGASARALRAGLLRADAGARPEPSREAGVGAA